MSGKIRDLIPASTGEGFRQVPKNSGIRASTEKWWNPGEYRKRVKSGRVPEKGPGEYRRRFRASTEEGFEQVPKKLRTSTGEGFGRVPEKVPGKYRKRVKSGRVPEKGPDEYQRRFRASTGEGFGQVPKKGSGKYRKSSGLVSEKGPGEYRKMVEFERSNSSTMPRNHRTKMG